MSNRDKINPEAVKYPREAKAEVGIISYLFRNPDMFKGILQRLPADKFVTSFNKKVYASMINKLENSLDFSLSSFNSEFSPDEMGKISEMLATTSEITITKASIDDYIDVLLSHIDSTNNNEEMTDDEFLNFFNKLKANK